MLEGTSLDHRNFENDFEAFLISDPLRIPQTDLDHKINTTSNDSWSPPMTLEDQRVEDHFQEGIAVRDFATHSFSSEAAERIHYEADVNREASLRHHEHIGAQVVDPVLKAAQTRRQACLRCRMAHQPASQSLPFFAINMPNRATLISNDRLNLVRGESSLQQLP